MRRTLFVLSIVLALSNAPPVRANDLPVGVSYQSAQMPTPLVINRLKLTPGAPVELQTIQTAGLTTTSQGCQAVDGLACINLDFFDPASNRTVTDYGPAVVAAWRVLQNLQTPLEAVSDDLLRGIPGDKVLVSRGLPMSFPGLNDPRDPHGYYGRQRPRTLVFLGSDRSLNLMTIDGDHPRYSLGLTMNQAVALSLANHAFTAINLDGGGSTTFALGNRVVNRPSGVNEAGETSPPGERPVKTVLAVVSRPQPAPVVATTLPAPVTSPLPKAKPMAKPVALKPRPSIELPTELDFGQRLADQQPKPARSLWLIPLGYLAYLMMDFVMKLQNRLCVRDGLRVALKSPDLQ